ncbi:MAG: hypothetical protein CL529_12640 [Aequorivita sp.]|nr:hypothetical protein [Aequorivita sp.]|tara:strand:+ start:25869 stop:26066 length:198 start_codon:yes stop_codon:yes gene_type:complete
MYLLEQRKFNRILKIWKPWEAKISFDEDNSANPRKEALQTFENIESTEGELWRVTHKSHIIIEQR